MSEQLSAETAPGKPPLRSAALWGLGCLLIRLPGIGALPIFNDESIFLRWAQLIAERPSELLTVALADPKPPVHFGLLALVVNAGDPLVAGRLLSALAGALTVFFAILLLHELGERRAIVAGAVLLVMSPWLAFHQRLATTDSLFVLESVAAIWLASRFPRDGVVPLAVLMGLTMGTRQVLSLLLWPVLLLAVPAGRRKWKLIVETVGLAFLVWSPYLVASPGRYLADPLSHLRARILFRPRYGNATPDLQRIIENVRDLNEWAWTYLTPPVVVAIVIAIGATALSTRFTRRVTVLLAGWAAFMLVPLVVFGTANGSRYALAGVMPLLLLLATAVARLRIRPAAAVLIVLSLLPARDLWLQMTRWSEQTLTVWDRWGYVTGWPAGHASEKAAAWLADRAARGPIVVLTDQLWGNPPDVVWLRLSKNPRVVLRYESPRGIRERKWSPRIVRSTVPEGLPVYRLYRGEPEKPVESLSRVEFRNPDGGAKVVVLRTR